MLNFQSSGVDGVDLSSSSVFPDVAIFFFYRKGFGI